MTASLRACSCTSLGKILQISDQLCITVVPLAEIPLLVPKMNALFSTELTNKTSGKLLTLATIYYIAIQTSRVGLPAIQIKQHTLTCNKTLQIQESGPLHKLKITEKTVHSDLFSQRIKPEKCNSTGKVKLHKR